VPDFGAAAAAGGETVSSAGMAGKVVLYYFWGTWCAPCVVSSPEIQAIHERFAGNDAVRVIAVHYDNRGNPEEYVAQHGYTFEVIPDGRSIVAAFGIKKVPQIVIVGRDGEVVYTQIGFVKGDGEGIGNVIQEQL
jgi:thiol-disulfide isomerase/thioredoxin